MSETINAEHSLTPNLGYQPRHANVRERYLERQIQASDEYRDKQVYRQHRAQLVTKRVSTAKAIKQLRVVAQACTLQAMAMEKTLQLQKELDGMYSESSLFYVGRHLREEADHDQEDEVEEQAAQTHPEPEVASAGLIPDAPEAKPPQEEPPEHEQTDQPDKSLGLGILAADEDAKPKIRRQSLSDKWRRANVAFTTYFGDPEKGRKRQIVAMLGGLALLGAIGFIASNFSTWRHGLDESPLPSPEPVSAVPPGEPPSPPQSPLPSPPTSQIPYAPPAVPPAFYIENLQPENYQGEAYEWGALENQVGSADATPQLLDMIATARKSGVHVVTWGDTSGDYWGITSVTTPVAGCRTETYYDTQHKLAILKYFSGPNPTGDGGSYVK